MLFYVLNSPERMFDLFPLVCVTLAKNNHILQKYGVRARGKTKGGRSRKITVHRGRKGLFNKSVKWT